MAPARASKKTIKSAPVELPVISIREFAGRFSNGVRISQQPFTWFLGAGCSKSSRILDAGGLVEKWLKELFELQGQSGAGFDAWVSANFPLFDAKIPSLSYAQTFARRHPSPVERQREIEMICSRGEPAYGYATLAQLLSHKDYGRFCNTVLTTNFDDLIADALYLYGERNARPLVVTHEALARYVRTNSPRPTVVKLHGDAHLDPKNLQPETREIDIGLAKQLYPFLQDHALIFVGYGGNDESILKFVQECPIPALAPPIYWVSQREPPSPFAKWLHQRNALRVNHTDFDQLMHLIRGALNIELLDRSRWTQIGDTYYEAFERLREEIDNVKASAEDTQALQAATSEAAKSLPDDWSYFQHARQQSNTDKVEAEKTFREGLEKFPESIVLNGNFAVFLERQERYDEAETCYKKALQIDPNRQIPLTNYAIFLGNIRKDADGAEALHKRAIDVGPKGAYGLSRYAEFLNKVRDDADGAEILFKRAVEADGGDVNTLLGYANFLSDDRNDFDAAEILFRQAVEAEPKSARGYRSFAFFLESKRNSLDRAEAYYKKAIEAEPRDAASLTFYADFLERFRENFDGAESFYKQALEADPDYEYALSCYSRLLEKIRNDPAAAADYRAREEALKIKRGSKSQDSIL
jgi:tetratricopeptide (TPR) repeat protein